MVKVDDETTTGRRGVRARASVTTLERALDYVARGWAVVPMHKPLDGGARCTCGRPECKNIGKHPWTRNGVKDATTDQAQVRAWWRANASEEQEPNIGIVTGAVSGILVLDVDAKSNGFDSLAQLQAHGHDVPRTIEATTGGGGKHYLFVHPGVPVKSRTSIMPGLDIRADGAAIVAAPSLHKSGKRYIWTPGRGPGEVELAPVPEWLLTLANQRDAKAKPKAKPDERATKNAVPEGGRNAELTRVAGGLRRKGLSETDIARILLAENRERCRPPLDEEEVLQIAASVSKYAPEGPRGFEEDFAIENGCFCIVKITRDGPRKEVIANLTAEIVTDILFDDGQEEQREYWIEGKDSAGKPLKLVRVPSSDFPSMNWIATAWGSSAIWRPGNGTKDQLRGAIQVFSNNKREEVVYKHSGWRNIEGFWFYLHAGGAIGADAVLKDIRVELEEHLRNINLPEPAPRGSRELRDAVRASLDLLNVSHDPRAGAVMILSAYRAMLCEVMPFTTAVWVEGLTGAFKTELALLAQAHYGTGFNNKSVPASWNDTPNSIERKSFFAKDVLFLVDDFVPRGSPSDVARLKGSVRQFIHYSVGNQSGRGRMNADGSQRRTYTPRGAVVCTGEDVPDGKSLRARMLVVSLDPRAGAKSGTIAEDRLTIAQADARAGKYAMAMSGFARWLAPRLDEMRVTFHERVVELRAQIADQLKHLGRKAHARTADGAASVFAAWETFLEYAQADAGITAEEKVELTKLMWTTLASVIASQAEVSDEDGPAEQFVATLRGALQAGRCYLAAHDARPPLNAESYGWRYTETLGGEVARETWSAPTDCIGWFPKDKPDVVYLYPETAIKVAKDFGRHRSDNYWDGNTIWRRVRSAGMLAERDETRDRNNVRRSRGGVDHTVYAMHAHLFGAGNGFSATEQAPEDDAAPPNSPAPGTLRAIQWTAAPSEAPDEGVLLSVISELQAKDGIARAGDIAVLAEERGMRREDVDRELNALARAGLVHATEEGGYRLTEASG